MQIFRNWLHKPTPRLDYEKLRHFEPCFVCGKLVNAQYCYCWGCSQVLCDDHSFTWTGNRSHEPEEHRKVHNGD